MFSKTHSADFLVLLCLAGILALAPMPPLLSVIASVPKTDAAPVDVSSLLADYSEYLSTGDTSHTASYSSAMSSLIEERRQYYAEFFEMGLHTNLDSLDSRFMVDDSVTSSEGDNIHVQVLEIVTMKGSSIIKTTEEYPMIPAAQWAISKTSDEAVQESLKEYIESTTYFVNQSISEGVEIVFRVNHNIDIVNNDGQLQIVRDEFTDKEIDNGDGFDNVTWLEGKPVRFRPDYTGMVDYGIYHTPIEVLGQQLLEDHTTAYNNAASRDGVDSVSSYSGSFPYYRLGAQNYALVHSSITNLTCSYDNRSYYMDTSYYGPLYQDIWSYTTTTCNDCANYVSQALRAGGFLSDSYWNSQGIGTYGWRVFDLTPGSQPGLAYYLQSIKQAIDVYTYSSSLYVGDLMYDTGGGHVVIVTGINPLTYSGHTNDRKNYNWSNVSTILTRFWHIKSSFPETYTFADVTPRHWAWQEIERLYRDYITAGCSTNPLNYCPERTVTRAEMAVFLLKGKHGSSYTPPPVGSSTGFNDVPTTYWAAAWIKQLAAEGITGGCSSYPPLYCPEATVTHAQMAVFRLKSKHGTAYWPPAVYGTRFADVPDNYWAADWIEQLAVEEISYGAHGCGSGNYCPDNPVSRAEMAGMLLRAFNLP